MLNCCTTCRTDLHRFGTGGATGVNVVLCYSAGDCLAEAAVGVMEVLYNSLLSYPVG